MSHGTLRIEKNCLNCGSHVEIRFCPNCGQENTESKKKFHYLFTHFLEDLTHYDGQFWKTLLFLFFKPGRLTKDYLLGKRKQFVAPVKLYIFISFITFLVPSFLPKSESATVSIKNDEVKNSSSKPEESLDYSQFFGGENIKKYDSIAALDNSFEMKLARPLAKKYFDLKAKGVDNKEFNDRLIETFIHGIPKAIFVYLPIFAWVLWLFHNKKKWWYFEHGVFTLHFFSYLLLSILFFSLASALQNVLPENMFFSLLFTVLYFSIFLYVPVYFVKAHQNFYGQKLWVSIPISIFLFFINIILSALLFLTVLYISFLNVH